MFSLGRVGSCLGEFCREKNEKMLNCSSRLPERKLEVLTGMVSPGRAGSRLGKN